MATKNFCLLGFSHDVETKLRQFIVKHAGDQSIDWVPANHNQLDGVVINATFLGSQQIQKFISKISCPCVCAYSGKDQTPPKSQDSDIIALDINSPSSTDSIWLSVLLGTAQQNDSGQSSSAQSVKNSGGFSKEYNRLIDLIDKTEDIAIFLKNHDKETWVFPAEQSAYINYSRDQIAGIENWEWKKVSKEELPGGLRKLRLEQWLFEAIWQSEKHDFKFEQQAQFQLLRWPQPLSRHKRTEALRIAAQIKLYPCSLADLTKKTDYSDHIVKQFLYAAVKTGQIKRIDRETFLNTAIPGNNAARKEVPPDPDRELKKSFLSRLRKRLGL